MRDGDCQRRPTNRDRRLSAEATFELTAMESHASLIRC
ncbi:hypothetical protein AOX55_00002389 [Sinorhizobium fredii CCBAU 25509]|nr:hypothetical protein SF83666_c21330 [Sinorhizobium fredii CCBAU 83666]AWM25640.1 hypothetical protein AOX55_00002389 [Sinorhizobium fredii CCBAU 25509]